MDKAKLTITLWIALAVSPVVQAACRTDIPPSAPSTRFTSNKDGTVLDKKTGLTWKVCHEGETWVAATTTTPESCTGTPTAFDWKSALSYINTDVNVAGSPANTGGWRMPNIKELSSILERRCYGPMLDPDTFPKSSGFGSEWRFWTSTPWNGYTPSNGNGSPANVWYVDIYNGRTSTIANTFSQLRLHLVKG